MHWMSVGELLLITTCYYARWNIMEWINLAMFYCIYIYIYNKKEKRNRQDISYMIRNQKKKLVDFNDELLMFLYTQTVSWCSISFLSFNLTNLLIPTLNPSPITILIKSIRSMCDKWYKWWRLDEQVSLW